MCHFWAKMFSERRGFLTLLSPNSSEFRSFFGDIDVFVTQNMSLFIKLHFNFARESVFALGGYKVRSLRTKTVHPYRSVPLCLKPGGCSPFDDDEKFLRTTKHFLFI